MRFRRRAESLPEVLVEALDYKRSEREIEAASRPPYPQPRRLQRHRERVLAALGEAPLPYGSEVATIATVRAPVESYASAVARFGRPEIFSFPFAVCLLTAAGALRIEEAHEVIAAVEGFDSRALRRQIVLLYLAAGDLAAADEEAARMDAEWAWTAHRSIGRHLARRGDAEAFFGRWPTYRATKGRDEIVAMKRELVEGVGRRDGWEVAVALCKDRRLGPDFAECAFAGSADRGEVEELARTFEGQAREVLDDTAELRILSRALVAAAGPAPAGDHPCLAEVLDRVVALDPKSSKETMRVRDGLLLDLWPAYGDEATLKRARAAARTPWIKGELKTLPREVPNPSRPGVER